MDTACQLSANPEERRRFGFLKEGIRDDCAAADTNQTRGRTLQVFVDVCTKRLASQKA